MTDTEQLEKTDDDALVEAAARARYLSIYGDHGGDWDAVDERYKESVWRKHARETIAATPLKTYRKALEDAHKALRHGNGMDAFNIITEALGK